MTEKIEKNISHVTGILWLSARYDSKAVSKILGIIFRWSFSIRPAVAWLPEQTSGRYGSLVAFNSFFCLALS